MHNLGGRCATDILRPMVKDFRFIEKDYRARSTVLGIPIFQAVFLRQYFYVLGSISELFGLLLKKCSGY